MFCIISVVMLLISIIASYLYFELWFSVARRFEGELLRVEATVTRVYAAEYGKVELEVKTSSIEDMPLTRGYRLRLELPSEDTASLRQGSIISLDCTLRDFEAGTGGFDEKHYYTSRGFSAEAIPIDAPTVIGELDLPDLEYLGKLIARRIITLSGEEAGGFFTALFTGDRSELSPRLSLAFTRIGINHVLALSGAHLAIISALVHFLLSALGVGKRPRWLLLMPVLFFYMALTGFSASVTRAGVMLTVTGLSHASARSHDSFTSLSAAVFLICLAEPYAIFDLGLWLSALATLGILEVGELERRVGSRWLHFSKRRKKSRLMPILTGLLLTVFAVGATLALSVFSFSGISPISVITTPVFSFLAEIYIYVGLAALLLGELLPVGWLLRPLYALTLWLAELMSDSDLACFSTEFTAVKVEAVLFTVGFAIFLALRLTSRQRAVCAALASVMLLSVFATSAVMTVSARADDAVIYRRGERSECFVLKSESCTAAIDLSSGSTVSVYDIREALDGEAILSLDKLVFCYYSANLPRKAVGIASSTLVRELLLPRPENAEERRIAEEVEAALAELDLKIGYHGSGGAIRIGSLKVRENFRSLYGEGAAVSVISICRDGEELCYLSQGVLADKLGYGYATDALARAECAVLGSGGRKYKERTVISEQYSSLREIVLSSENLVFTQDARIYYGERGAEFYLRPTRVELLDKWGANRAPTQGQP